MAHKHPVHDTDKHFVIDPISKTITTECRKLTIPQHSHRSERFTFEIPKMVEGHDMSQCNVVEIHFQNIDNEDKTQKNIGIYTVDDLQADGETVFCSWLIDGKATYYAGGLVFAIHFSCVADNGKVEYNLPTMCYSVITIGRTVWNSETIAKEHSDVIASFEARIEALENGANTSGGSSARVAEITLLAANWTGSASPYSQIVSVPDVTSRSQVDLTPSVEQLAVFHNKDLTFVAENENGVVTVYAIGEKPQNDYTMQVTITEVSV